MKFFMKYIGTTQMAFKSAPNYWKNYFTGGKLEAFEFGENHLTLRIHDFKVHPIMCIQLSGYFLGVAIITNVKDGRIEETRCVHRGDDFCEFKIHYSKATK